MPDHPRPARQRTESRAQSDLAAGRLGANRLTVGERLRYLRRECGLTQEEASEKCGVAPSQWSRWETAEEPSLRSIRSIAEGFGLSVGYVGWIVVGDMDRPNSAAPPEVRESIRRAYDELSRWVSGTAAFSSTERR